MTAPSKTAPGAPGPAWDVRYLPPPDRHGIAGLLLGAISNGDRDGGESSDTRSPRPLMICVHGYTRQPLEHLEVFAPWARSRGWDLLLPIFGEDRHPAFQRLRARGRSRRPDLALRDLVARAAPAQAHRRWLLFGYSAGAQFVHRFALVHPQHVAAMALGAAGWYTWPDAEIPFPRGWGCPRDPSLVLHPAAFLQAPMAVWVGERDGQVDRHLRQDPRTVAQQGQGRLDRAQAWIQALDRVRLARGLDALPPVSTVPDAGHSLTACNRRGDLGASVTAFLAAHAHRCEGPAEVSAKVDLSRPAPWPPAAPVAAAPAAGTAATGPRAAPAARPRWPAPAG
jgi:pimeloyl-ACP methyl ester carboxylesterase